jgi:hypothetical protein
VLIFKGLQFLVLLEVMADVSVVGLLLLLGFGVSVVFGC